MSQAGRQILQLELDNLHAEKAQRERKLDMLLGRLRKACIELDEDDNAAAAAAHPSLQHHRSVPLQSVDAKATGVQHPLIAKKLDCYSVAHSSLMCLLYTFDLPYLFRVFHHLNPVRASKLPCSCSFCSVLHDGLHDGNLPASHN